MGGGARGPRGVEILILLCAASLLLFAIAFRNAPNKCDRLAEPFAGPDSP